MDLKQLNGGSEQTSSVCQARNANHRGPSLVPFFLPILFFISISGNLGLLAQNCDVAFPGTSNLLFSNTCGGPSIDDLHLGKDIHLGTGDSYTFDSPSVITIRGNLHIDANGSNKIIIPPGVTVNVQGNVDLHSKDKQCNDNAPCTLVFEVYGTLNILGNLKNDVVTLQWEGTGKVETTNNFENSNKGCMTCGNNCPTFLGVDCKDSGKGCTISDFCAAVNYGKSTPTGLVINNCPANIVVSTNTSNCQATVDWVAPTVVDDGTLISFSSTHNPGDVFAIGVTTVIYTAVDLHGNTVNCSFNVEVRDLTPPVITPCPGDIMVNEITPGETGATVNWTAPNATDNCSLQSLISTHSPGDVFPIGVTTVTYTAQDASGNQSTCSFNVTIDNNNPPVAEPASLNTQNGQPVLVCFKATDPEGDPLLLTNVDPGNSSGTIDKIDASGLCFSYTPAPGGSETAIITATICDDRSACVETTAEITVINIELVVFQAITPNGDGANDQWQIENIELFPDNQVTVFDRWGSVVYQAQGYNNESVVWSGVSKSSNSSLPSGTYFFHIQINGAEAKTGFVELINDL